MIFEKIKQSIQPQEIDKKSIIIFSLLAIGIMVANIWLRDLTNELSINLYESFYYSSPRTLENLAFVGKINGTTTTVIIISIFLLNLANVFKLLIFHCIIYMCLGLSAFLKLVYRHEMLFVIAENKGQHLEPQDCNYTWASVSAQSMLCSSMALTLCLIIIREKWMTYIKILCYFFTILFLVGYNLCIFCFGIHTISDIIFSSLLGGVVFFLYTLVLKIDFNKSHDMKLFMLRTKITYLAFNIFIILSCLILYFLSKPLTGNNEDIRLTAISHTNCFFDFPDNTNISNDALILLLLFITNFMCVFGIFLDQCLLSKNDENKWRFFNFEDDQNELESIYTFSEDVKKAQWNDTTAGITSLRILIGFIVLGLSYIPMIFIPFKVSDLFFLVLFGKYFFPFLYQSFCYFFLLKFIYIKLGLINNNAFKRGGSDSNSPSILQDF